MPKPNLGSIPILVTQADANGNVTGASDAPLYTSQGGGPYTLMSNASALGNQTAVTGIIGASYIWNVVGTFGGTTVKLQALGSDGVTYQDIVYPTTASMTSGGSMGVVLGANATVRAVMTSGTPSGMYSKLT